MTTYLVDTNVLINALNGKLGHRELLRKLAAQGHGLATCTIVLAELFSGLRPADRPVVASFMSAWHWYDSSPLIARRAGELRFEYARQGRTLSLADTLIAATVLEYGASLITANRKDFPMPELVLYPLEHD